MKSVLLVLTLLLLASYKCLASVHVTLHSEVTLSARAYTLQDVADIQSDKAEVVERLQHSVIGKAPRPGQIAHVTPFQVQARIAQLHPRLADSIRWQSSGKTLIRSKGVQYDREGVQRVAEEHLRQWLEERHEQVNIRALSEKERPLIVPPGELRLTARLSPSVQLNKRMAVWVDLRVDGEHFQTLPLWFDVAVYEAVMVVNKTIDTHHRLKDGDYMRELQDITALNGEPVKDASQWQQHRLVDKVTAGEVLLKAMLEPIPAVTKNQLITVLANHGKVTIATRAKALSKGELAERIRVEHPDNGATYTVTVISPGLGRVY